jgi:hypothetical protein
MHTAELSRDKNVGNRFLDKNLLNVNSELVYRKRRKESKAVHVTDPGGPYGCEMSRLPHFLQNRLKDGVKIVSLTSRPPFTRRKISGTHFFYKLSRPQGYNACVRIRSVEESDDLIGNRIRDFPACSMVP